MQFCNRLIFLKRFYSYVIVKPNVTHQEVDRTLIEQVVKERVGNDNGPG